ncbi:MAG: molecular chaperone DjiA [Alphaproteobacteria bacterium]|nr:molecular chaperone DjiA [Alphaproteobacteria bacterium]
MSIWGKVLGGVAGFALGGPLGALIGAVAGHVVDRASGQGAGPDVATKQVAFTIALVVLAAKLAKADGVVTRDEVAAFKRVFRIPESEIRGVGELFNRAKADAAGFEPYARQIGEIFQGRPAILEELLDALFVIAKADGTISGPEIALLEKVAQRFGLEDGVFARLAAEHGAAVSKDPYVILGVARSVGDPELKAAYRKLVRENHPDTLMADGMPPEFAALANQRLALINDAYDRLARERGLR